MADASLRAHRSQPWHDAKAGITAQSGWSRATLVGSTGVAKAFVAPEGEGCPMMSGCEMGTDSACSRFFVSAKESSRQSSV